LLITSLLAAFMSTLDTHFNWGASYVVNDVWLRIRPDSPPAAQVRVARTAVVGFALLALAVSFQIDTIEQAWTWVAFIGAALGVPTALRWVWWRVNAWGELGAVAAGLGGGLLVVTLTPSPYEVQLLATGLCGVVGMALGMVLGPGPGRADVDRFTAKVA